MDRDDQAAAEDPPSAPDEDSGHGRYRSVRDEQIALALATGRNQREAADAAGVSERTVRRRLDDPVFAARVDEARDSLYAMALSRLSAHYDQAAGTLVELLAAPGRDNVRLRAAQAILNVGDEQVRTRRLDARIDKLEREVDAQIAREEDDQL